MKTRSNNNTSGNARSPSGMNTELHAVFLDELADMHSAEHQITKALPKMAKAAESEDLREAFEAHLDETQIHIKRLEDAFRLLDEKVKSKTCDGIKGILKEGEEMMKEQKDSSALDAVLIAGAQKVEHYEIASYGTLIAWAEQMRHEDVVELLQQNLNDEKAADKKLTSLATEQANQKA